MTIPRGTPLAESAARILRTADPHAKVTLTRAAAAAWDGRTVGRAALPDRPARPEHPELRPPRDMPKRSTGPKGLVGLLHALAHIELNAIDLAWDIIARFPEQDMPAAFHADWLEVAVDEALHYERLATHLVALGSRYGDLPAHDGLWGAAMSTADDLYARLAVVPMTHEARGLDTTPATLDRMTRVGTDPAIIATLTVIYKDEIRHVQAGVRWFGWLCARDGLDPAATFLDKLRDHYPGGLKPPFNHAAREEAGFPQEWYLPASGSSGQSTRNPPPGTPLGK